MRIRHVFQVLVATLALAVPAMADTGSVEGLWSPDGFSDYRVTLCGPQKDKFCLTVVALRAGADKPRNRPYIGKNIIDLAEPAGNNTWRGKLNLFGQSADGTIVFSAPDRIEFKGCLLLVVCQSITLKRIGD